MSGYVTESKTICWNCSKACTAGCSWSERLEPVDGWTVEETISKNGSTGITVLSCPEFVKELPRSERERTEMDTAGCLGMIEKLMLMTHDDYVTGTDDECKKIERFIRGRGASKVHMITNPNAVIKKLKQERAKYKVEHGKVMKAEEIEKICKNAIETGDIPVVSSAYEFYYSILEMIEEHRKRIIELEDESERLKTS